MPLIYVRARVGRVARIEPGGDLIPYDRFVPVRPTRWINRLLNVHGDIELQPKAEPRREEPKARDEHRADKKD